MANRSRGTVLCLTILLGTTSVVPAQEGTLMDVFEGGRVAFLEERHDEAMSYFRALARDFSREPEYQDLEFQRRLLPMFGISALFAGEPAVCVEVLHPYLERGYQGQANDALVLLGLIQATRQLELYADLDGLYQRFLTDFPTHPDLAMVRFERMVMLFYQGKQPEAELEMKAIAKARGSEDLKVRARLATVQFRLNQGDWDGASELLFDGAWQVSQMPEMAVLAISALQLGDYYMEQQQWKQALRSYRWVPLHSTLIDRQQRHVLQLTQRLSQRNGASRAHASPVWWAHYQQLLAQMEASLAHLEASADYTPVFLLKLGRCHLFESHFTEAWVLFRSLALAPELDSTLREQAWYHWILASHGGEDWEEARQLCGGFASQFPESDLLPQTFFLLARTHQEAGNLVLANAVLTELLERFPEHEDRVDWWVTRGYHCMQLNQNEAALLDFERARSTPGIRTALWVQASYWRAITLSAMGEFDPARESLQDLMQRFPEHWMFPEFQYRLGRVEYSRRNYDEAESLLNAFIADFPDHVYHPEARVLLGDIAMGKGALELALDRFRSIVPADAHWYFYAVFQIGKILRAQALYSEMEQHFRSLLETPSVTVSERASEILYWLGWALEQQGREDETLDLYLDAYHRFGDDPGAAGVIPVVEALPGLHRNAAAVELGCDPGVRSDAALRFAQAPSFESWLEQEKEAAQARDRPTLNARLRLFEALQLRRQQQPDRARKTLQQISLDTPLEAMDAALLGEIGVSLAEDGFDAAMQYLRALLLRYPQSPAKALAYVGLARRAADRAQWLEASTWLQRFDRETPHHARQFEARLLHAQVLLEANQPAQAVDLYNDLLRTKAARGRTHVLALQGLAQLHEHIAEPAKAVAYYQRIYTLYRGELEAVAQAYARSAALFEQLGDVGAALRTWEALALQRDLTPFPAFRQAATEVARLRSLLAGASGSSESSANRSDASSSESKEGSP